MILTSVIIESNYINIFSINIFERVKVELERGNIKL